MKKRLSKRHNRKDDSRVCEDNYLHKNQTNRKCTTRGYFIKSKSMEGCKPLNRSQPDQSKIYGFGAF